MRKQRKLETEDNIVERQVYFKDFDADMIAKMDEKARIANRLKARDTTRRYRARKKEAAARNPELQPKTEEDEEPAPKLQVLDHTSGPGYIIPNQTLSD